MPCLFRCYYVTLAEKVSSLLFKVTVFSLKPFFLAPSNSHMMWGLKCGHSFPAADVQEVCHFQYYYDLSLIFMHHCSLLSSSPQKPATT